MSSKMSIASDCRSPSVSRRAPGSHRNKNNKAIRDLHHAARTGDTIGVKCLLDKGVPIEGKVTGMTPLMAAVWKNQHFTTALLLEKGADPNARFDDESYSALHKAGDPEIAEMLLKNGADVNPVNILYGYTPLHYSVIMHSPKKVQVLLRYKAKLNIRDNDGRTPLMTAIRINKTLIALQLLQAGADPNIPDNHGRFPADFTYRRDPMLIEELKACGAKKSTDDDLRCLIS